jgi:hypothetical protein
MVRPPGASREQRRRQAAAALCEARVHTPGQAWPLAGGAQGAGGCAPADAAAQSAVHFLAVQDGCWRVQGPLTCSPGSPQGLEAFFCVWRWTGKAGRLAPVPGHHLCADEV